MDAIDYFYKNIKRYQFKIIRTGKNEFSKEERSMSCVKYLYISQRILHL